jgi:hypothetical protein
VSDQTEPRQAFTRLNAQVGGIVDARAFRRDASKPGRSSRRESFTTVGFWNDSVKVVLLALLVRSLVVAWGASRFPPAADGQFYHVVAGRIARGLGYTWLWPDGAVTYAAHYPVGYPAILGALYALFGFKPMLAMVLNGFAGAVTTLAVHRMSLHVAPRGPALFAGIVAALHPTFVFYTPAMMTELVSAALVVVSAALAWKLPRTRLEFSVLLVGIGLLVGGATLVRPQLILWAPVFGAWLVFRTFRATDVEGFRFGHDASSRFNWRWGAGIGFGALVATSIAVACCLPWTVRNCDRMEQCVFVSANGGWNLYIGSSELGRGAWTSIDSIGVPHECQTVFKEAEKDVCFGQAAKRRIVENPLAWLLLAPAKLSKTFDDVGAPGYYLNASNSSVFGDEAKWWLGASEVLIQRFLSIASALTLAFVPGPRKRGRWGLSALAIGCTCVPFAWVGVLAFCLGTLLLGYRLLEEPALLFLAVAWTMTAIVHAVFFGGARYAMVVLPFVIVAAARCFARPWAERSDA